MIFHCASKKVHLLIHLLNVLQEKEETHTSMYENLYAMMDYAKWRFLSSGMYRPYLSIDKNRTSVGRNFNAKQLY